MKILRYCFAVAICFLMNSCLDTEEQIALNTNGGGNYKIVVNMDGILSKIKMFAQQQDLSALDKIDSSIYLKDYVDTASQISAEDKALLRDGSLALHADADKDEMSFSISVPFKQNADLNLIKERLASIMNNTSLLSSAMSMGGEMPGGNNEMRMNSPKNSINPFEKAYSFSVSESTVSNSLVNKKFITDTLAQDSSMQMMKQMAPLFGDTRYTATFALPREAKHYSGNNIKLSDDKKTISFSATLTEILDNPELLEYRVDF